MATIRNAVSTERQLPPDLDPIGHSALRKAALRLIPVLAIAYALAFLDRQNVSFASLQMNRALHFNASTYGFGAGVFFVGYALFEVPSNLLLLRFGSKKWLTRIMFTWGVIATAMMFVHSATTFFTLRFLLGIAEAGFFPGVVYYLTLWFPLWIRGRAISWFYIAPPLSGVVMGALAGSLLGLGGKMGLAGWQWLFLAEGLPAIAFSFVIFLMLPDGPDKAGWLTPAEKLWLESELEKDRSKAHIKSDAPLTHSLFSPKVLLIGSFFFFLQFASNAYGFSAPTIIKGISGWTDKEVGLFTAGSGIIGIAAMLLNTMHSDRTKERAWHAIIPCLAMGVTYLIASFLKTPIPFLATITVCFIAYNALLVPALALPTEFLAGKSAATGIATMNTITMIGGFLGPIWMGIAKDVTGGYALGLRSLAMPCFLAAGVMIVLIRLLRAQPAPAPNGGSPDLPEASFDSA